METTVVQIQIRFGLSARAQCHIIREIRQIERQFKSLRMMFRLFFQLPSKSRCKLNRLFGLLVELSKPNWIRHYVENVIVRKY